MKAYTVTRDVTPEECFWLREPVLAGTTVYQFTHPTYGVVSTGLAVTLDSEGDYPFFELPHDAVEVIGDSSPDGGVTSAVFDLIDEGNP